MWLDRGEYEALTPLEGGLVEKVYEALYEATRIDGQRIAGALMHQHVQIREDRVEICISIGEGIDTGAANWEKQLDDLFEWFYEETEGVLQRPAKKDKQIYALVLVAHAHAPPLS